jgi:biopolymer transport protein ExbD
MPKVKIPRKSTSIDMTAMCDVAFLLLTFFMLTTKFKPPEPLQVDTPSSTVAQAIPDKNMILLTIRDNRVFLDVDQQQVRVQALEMMGTKYGVSFTDQEKAVFSNIGTFGAPMSNMKQLLSSAVNERDILASKMPGIPRDTVNFDKCELFDWLIFIRQIKQSNQNDVKVAVKGDVNTPYPVIQNVISVLQKQNINQFSFVTNMEAKPTNLKN